MLGSSPNKCSTQVVVFFCAIEFPATLTSRHKERRAIDMTISWVGTLTVRDFDGQERRITMPPRSMAVTNGEAT